MSSILSKRTKKKKDKAQPIDLGALKSREEALQAQTTHYLNMEARWRIGFKRLLAVTIILALLLLLSIGLFLK